MAALTALRRTMTVCVAVVLVSCRPYVSADLALSSYRQAGEVRAQALAGLEPPSGGASVRTLTVDQAVALALRTNRELDYQRAAIPVARAGVGEAAALDSLSLRLGRIRADELLLPARTYDVVLQVTPPRPFEMSARVSAARSHVSEVQATVRAAEQKVEGDARLRFEEVRLIDAELEAARATVEAGRRLSELARTRLERNISTRMDAALADLSYQEALQNLAELESQRQKSLGALLDRIGLAADTPVTLVYEPVSPDVAATFPDEKALIDAALHRRPELAAAAARLETADANTRLAWIRQGPSLAFVQVGYELAPVPHAPDFAPWSFSAGLEIPIPGFNRGGVRKARADETLVGRELDAEVEAVIWQVRDTLRQLRQAGEALHAYNSGAVLAAERAGAEVKGALDAGRVDLLQYALVEERRAAVQQRRMKLLRSYYEALANLRIAVGGELPGAGK